MKCCRVLASFCLPLAACLTGCVDAWDLRVSNQTDQRVAVVKIEPEGNTNFGFWSPGSVSPHSVVTFRGEIPRNREGYRFRFLDSRCMVIQENVLTYDQMINQLRANTLTLSVTTEPAGVGGMPLGREHCPRMTIEALRDALP